MRDATTRDELSSGIFMVPQMGDEGSEQRKVEDRFIEAWARLAGAFAMDTTMGRIHALVYMSPSEVDATTISHRLGLSREVVELHLETLTDWQLVYESRTGYTAEQDPWTWFVRAVRARQNRELLPIRSAVESVRDAARALLSSSDSANAARLRTIVSRIERFTAFVGDVAKLVDTLVSLGAGPMLKFVQMSTRFMPRRAA